jgi:hypothetical protein
MSDGCGGIVDCGGCGPGEACGAGGVANTCAPWHDPWCVANGYSCGSWGNDCGQSVTCGTCDANARCENGHCVQCAQKTCAQLGATCGTSFDGCAGYVSCGTCGPGTLCDQSSGAGHCVACQQRTCGAQDFQCGSHSDACGGWLDCGDCAANQRCSPGVDSMGRETAKCVACMPKTCAQLGAQCGVYSDGCGGTLNCGTCGTGSTCTHGYDPMGFESWTCQTCTPKTCAQLGAQCGYISDGCGATLNCGTCGTGSQCTQGVDPNGFESWSCQTCTPRTCAQLGQQCGAVSDGCGGVLSCGTCSSGQCMSGHCCQPHACGFEDCGTISDGCGGSITCTSCGGGGTGGGATGGTGGGPT